MGSEISFCRDAKVERLGRRCVSESVDEFEGDEACDGGKVVFDVDGFVEEIGCKDCGGFDG